MRRLALVCALLAVAAATIAQPGESDSITGRVLVSPLSVAVSVPDSPRRRGATFRIAATVANAGPARLENVVVTLVRNTAIRLDRPPAQTIPRIPALASRRTVWEACSNAPDTYVVLARAHVGPFHAESPAAVLRILPSSRNC